MLRTCCRVATGLVLALGGTAAAHPPSDQTLARLDGALVRDPSDLRLRVRRAEERLAAGALALCEADLAEVLARSPARADALVLLARLHARRGQRKEALAVLDRVLAAETFAPAALDRAALRKQAGDLGGARADLDLALAAHPDPDGYLERARLDRARGASVALVEGLAEGASRTGAAVLVEAHIEALVEQRRAAEAFAAADAALARQPGSMELRLLRARALEMSGERSAATRERLSALAMVDRALAQRDSDVLRLARARVLGALGRTRAARLLRAEIAARSPGLVRAVDGPRP